MELEKLIRLTGVEINAAEDGKIKICPHGFVVGLDARKFAVDGAGVVAATKAAGLKIPLLVEHGFNSNYGEKAAGWIEPQTLEIREDGIYATLEKNALGEELIGGKNYLYLSPGLTREFVEDIRVVKEIVEVSLVNSPNFVMPEVNNQEETVQEKTENAQENAHEKEAEQTAELTALETLQKANHALKVDLAIERNQLLPKDREFALELSETQLEKYIAQNGNQEAQKRLKTASAQPDKNSAKDRSKELVNKAVKTAQGGK